MKIVPKLLGIIVYLISLTGRVRAISEYQSLVVVKDFADALVDPQRVALGQEGGSGLFAEDVKGLVDIAGELEGRQLATDFLFGLFSSGNDSSIPSFIGTPKSYLVTSLAVQEHFVTAVLRVDLEYLSVNRNLPVDLNAWFAVNDAGQISQFDISFKRWAWAMETILSHLLPRMASWADTNSTDASIILRSYLTRSLCTSVSHNCARLDQPRWSLEECTAFTASLPIGEMDRLDDDSLACRAVHASLVPLRPALYCPMLGATSSRCKARKYEETIGQKHFSEEFVAPKMLTPENAPQIADYQVRNGEPLIPLVEIDWSVPLFDVKLGPESLCHCHICFLPYSVAQCQAAPHPVRAILSPIPSFTIRHPSSQCNHVCAQHHLHHYRPHSPARLSSGILAGLSIISINLHSNHVGDHLFAVLL